METTQTELTTSQKILYWSKALSHQRDFYLNGKRFVAANKVKGRIVATEVCGPVLDAVEDITDLLLSGARPHNHKGEVYMSVPDRVEMMLYRNQKSAMATAT